MGRHAPPRRHHLRHHGQRPPPRLGQEDRLAGHRQARRHHRRPRRPPPDHPPGRARQLRDEKWDGLPPTVASSPVAQTSRLLPPGVPARRPELATTFPPAPRRRVDLPRVSGDPSPSCTPPPTPPHPTPPHPPPPSTLQ